MYQRRYQETHPWISYVFKVNSIDNATIFHLGEALSKCDHICGAPLPPQAAADLNQVFLTKGVHATTSIEGNSLTEDQVRQRLDGDLELPESIEYQGIEIDNLIEVLNQINVECATGELAPLTVEKIKSWNRDVLAGQPVADGVTPGEFRTSSVVVGSVYRGAPAEDCAYLMDRFIQFINEVLVTDNPFWQRPMGILRAIVAHLYLAWIHPFGDGNGRTARLIEFQLLIEAGIPVPAAHVLSDYYNRSRALYYLSLERASTLPDHDEGVAQFIAYAVKGFVEGLREQVDQIEAHQLRIAWLSYVHEVFSRERHSDSWRRRRALVLAMPISPTPRSDLTKLTPELAELYAGTSSKTLTRDLNILLDRGLIHRSGRGFTSSQGDMAAFLPASIDPTTLAGD